MCSVLISSWPTVAWMVFVVFDRTFTVFRRFFATPVIYPLSVFPPNLLQLLSYNPIAQVIFLARDVTLYAKAPNLASFTFVIVIAFVIVAVGYAIFSRLEPRFAEEL